jgi:hypothetical protein
MKIQIGTYKFFDIYGFSWQFGKKFGNSTPVYLRPVAKLLWNSGLRRTLIGKK